MDFVAGRFESSPAGTVFNCTEFALVVDVAIFAKNFAVGVFSFYLVCAIGRFVAVAVRPVFVVLVDLFKNGNGGCVLLGRRYGKYRGS